MTVLRQTAIDAAPRRGRNEVEDGRERLSWPARNANLFAGEESCVWPLRPRRSRRRRPSVTPDPSRSAWVWPVRTAWITTGLHGYRRSSTDAPLKASFRHYALTSSRLWSCPPLRRLRRPPRSRSHRTLAEPAPAGRRPCQPARALRLACAPTPLTTATPRTGRVRRKGARSPGNDRNRVCPTKNSDRWWGSYSANRRTPCRTQRLRTVVFVTT